MRKLAYIVGYIFVIATVIMWGVTIYKALGGWQ